MTAISHPSTPRAALHSIPWITIGKVLLVASTVSGIAIALLASELALALGIALYGTALWVWSKSCSLHMANQQLRTECNQAAAQIKQLQMTINQKLPIIQTLETQNQALREFLDKTGSSVVYQLNKIKEQIAQQNLSTTKSVEPPVQTPDHSVAIVEQIKTLTEKQGILFSDLQEQLTKLTPPPADTTLSSQLTELSTLVERFVNQPPPKESPSPNAKVSVPRLSIPHREQNAIPSEEPSSPATPKQHAPTPRKGAPATTANSTLSPEISQVLSKFEQLEVRLSQFDHLADLLQQLLEKSRQSSVEPEILLPNVSMVDPSLRRLDSQSALPTSRLPSTSRLSKLDLKLKQVEEIISRLHGIAQLISEDRVQREAFHNLFRTNENQLNDMAQRFVELMRKREQALDRKINGAKTTEATVTNELAELKRAIYDRFPPPEATKPTKTPTLPASTARKPVRPKDASSSSSTEPTAT